MQYLSALWHSKPAQQRRAEDTSSHATREAKEPLLPLPLHPISGASSSSLRRQHAPQAATEIPPAAPTVPIFSIEDVHAGDIVVVQDEKPISKTTWLRWVIRIGQKLFGLSQNNRRIHTSVVVHAQAHEPANTLYIVEGDSPHAVRVPLAQLVEREKGASSLFIYRFTRPIIASTLSSVATIMQQDGTLYFGRKDFVRSALKRTRPEPMTDHMPVRANCSTFAAYAINAGLIADEDVSYLASGTHPRVRIPTSPQILSAEFDTGTLPCTRVGVIPHKTA